MLKRTNYAVPVHTQAALDRDTVAIVYNIIGNIKNCQDVSFHLMLRKPLIGLLKTSLRFGVKNLVRNRGDVHETVTSWAVHDYR